MAITCIFDAHLATQQPCKRHIEPYMYCCRRRFNFRLHRIQAAAAPRQVLPKLPQGWSPTAAVSRAGEGRRHGELPRKTDRVAARVAQADDAGALFFRELTLPEQFSAISTWSSATSKDLELRSLQLIQGN